MTDLPAPGTSARSRLAAACGGRIPMRVSSRRWISPRHLAHLEPAIAGDQPAATGRRGRRPHVADQRALLWTARQQEPRTREVAQGLEDRLVERSRGAT